MGEGRHKKRGKKKTKTHTTLERGEKQETHNTRKRAAGQRERWKGWEISMKGPEGSRGRKTHCLLCISRSIGHFNTFFPSLTITT